MRILYIHNDYARPSGEESASAALAQMLRDHGHEVEFFRRSSAEIADSAGGKIKAFFAGICNPFAARAVAAKLDEFKPDLVQVQNLYPLLSPSIFKPIKQRRLPVVMRCPNYRLFCPNGLCYNGEVCERCFGGREWNCALRSCAGGRFKSLGYALRGWAARVSKRILNNVDMFIVQTEFQKRKFVEQGIPEEKLGIVPGIMPDVAPADKWEPGKYVTFVGRVSPEKGIDEFLAAARQLPDIPFAVAGAYDGMPEIVKDAPSNVEFKGFWRGDDLRRAYLDSRFIVVPSKWYEGFPNVIVMSMMLKRPTLTAAIGATGSIITDGVDGVLFHPGDTADLVAKIRGLYDDLPRCRAMGEAGALEAEKRYSREKIYECLLDICDRAFEHNRQRR